MLTWTYPTEAALTSLKSQHGKQGPWELQDIKKNQFLQESEIICASIAA